MTHATPFEAMAARIGNIADGEFQGAVVVVPPDGTDPIEFLMSGPRQDIVLFWSSVKSLVEVRATEAMHTEESRRQGHRAFGR